VFEPQQSSGHLVFLSARPESYKGFTEGISFKRIFEPLVRTGDLQGKPPPGRPCALFQVWLPSYACVHPCLYNEVAWACAWSLLSHHKTSCWL